MYSLLPALAIIALFFTQGHGDRAPAIQQDLVVTTDWLAGHVGEQDVVILHVAADKKTFDAGHIPGARFVASTELAVSRDGRTNELPPAADLVALFTRVGIGETGRIVLYGDGHGLWAARALFTLDYLGQSGRAALLDGGLEKWKREGRALETAEKDVTPRPFAVRPNTDVLVTLDEMRDYSWIASHQVPSPVAIADARPGAQFAGTETPDGERSGHIPGAASLFWETTLVSRDNPVLRSPSELREIWERAGAAPGKTIVTYCRTGVQASFDYFVARYLGYAPKIYDGSFAEWTHAAGAEVVK